jgi:hypothetical protein
MYMFSITYVNIMNIFTTKPEIGAKGFNACLIIMYGLALSCNHKDSNITCIPYLGFKVPQKHGA